MGLFSEELLELDRNTVKYMIDEMQEEIDASKRVIEEKDQILEEKEQALKKQGMQLAEQDMALEKKEQQLQQQVAEQNLYKKLEREGRHEELLHAIRDEVYKKSLLEKINGSR